MPVSLEETVALGSAIGRQAAADLYAETNFDLTAFGMANDALEDAEQVIRRIDARLGAGEGNRVAFALRHGIMLLLREAEDKTEREAVREAAMNIIGQTQDLKGPTGA